MAETKELATCNCDRCGRLCRVGPSDAKDVKPIRRSEKPKGSCVNCAVTNFIKTTCEHALGPDFDPAHFQLPHLQQQFTQLCKVGGCAAADEVDWEQVIANWALPVSKGWKAYG